MFLGLAVGFLAIIFHFQVFITDWIKPFGTLFINALKLIAVPLVLFSLVTGISSMKDTAALGDLGWKSLLTYIVSTVIAISVGLTLVNVIQPWKLSDGMGITTEIGQYQEIARSKAIEVAAVKDGGPLQFVSDLVPSNLLAAASNNGNMLQVIVFAVLFGVALVAISKDKAKPVVAFFEGVNEVILKMVDLIMRIAPFGTFALITSFLTDQAGDDFNQALGLMQLLGMYVLTVLLGLSAMLLIVYPSFLYFVAKVSPKQFFKAMAPAQLLAFSTSSSAATLPLTMECVQDNLGVKREVSGFVLPLGATINMDGTSCYQAIAAVFISFLMGVNLSFGDQLGIVVTATLASIGSAAVPGAGMIMLAIVLSHLQVPLEGIAIILGVDRILDMCRTVINVTSDACIAVFLNRVSDHSSE